MKTLFPAASACFVMAFVASVGFAESKLESDVDSKVRTSEATETEQPLSVAPMSHVAYPDDRPAWIDAEPDFESPDHTWVVVTSGCETIEQCEAELEALKPAAVALYIKETTGWVCDESMLDEQWIENQLVAARYIGQLTQGDRELHEIAVQLKFDSDSRQKIRLAMNNSVVGERLRATGGLFALAVIGLCCTGGLLGIASRRFS